MRKQKGIIEDDYSMLSKGKRDYSDKRLTAMVLEDQMSDNCRNRFFDLKRR